MFRSRVMPRTIPMMPPTPILTIGTMGNFQGPLHEIALSPTAYSGAS